MLPTNRIRAAVELMRLPLVITAISDSQAAYFLFTVSHPGRTWDLVASLCLLAMSAGLYCFGMVINDIIDIRRDRFLRPHRPLPSGRIGMQQAYLLAAGLLILGLVGGLGFALAPSGGGFMSIFFLTWTILLIFFYNLAGKFVGAVGILTLGMARFFHAAVAQPHLPVLWQPLLLMDHVTLLTLVCYALEGKHPRLTKGHWWTVLGGLFLLNVMLAGGVVLAMFLRSNSGAGMVDSLGLHRGLLWPIGAMVIFVALAAAVLLSLREQEGLDNRELLERRRKTGRQLMFSGLLWLVIYDLGFVIGFGR